jgi:hypothetical protein
LQGGVVIFERDVRGLELEQIGNRRVEPDARQRSRHPLEQLPRLCEVVEIKVCVTDHVHELANLKLGDLRHHRREQRIGGDIERHAEEDGGCRCGRPP